MKVGDRVEIIDLHESDAKRGFYSGGVGEVIRFTDKGNPVVRDEKGNENWFKPNQLKLLESGVIATMPTKIGKAASNLRETIRPYERYILLALLFIVIDHFLFKNKFQKTIKGLASKVLDKISATLDSFISGL